MNIIDTALSTVESLALGLNLLTIYLIRRMGTKEIDMWLGLTMAVCDLIIASFKLMELPLQALIRKISSLMGYNIAITLNGLVVLFVVSSITSVGYLSILRWLAICRGYSLDKLKYAKPIYLSHLTFLSIIIYLCYTNEGFVFIPGENYYYPVFFITTSSWGLVTNLTLTLNILFCLLSFNISYILITSRYLDRLNRVDSNSCQNLVIRLNQEKFKIVLNIILMLTLYNLTLVPLLAINLTELVNTQAHSLTANLLTSSGIFKITFINPAMLIFIHSDTRREFMKLITTTPKRTPYYPLLDDLDANGSSL